MPCFPDLLADVGLLVGELVGCVGELVTGELVGELVGTLVGELVGALVGELVGTLVGELVGTLVGELVGSLVGEEVVGTLVGELVGSLVGEEVVGDSDGVLVVGEEVVLEDLDFLNDFEDLGNCSHPAAVARPLNDPSRLNAFKSVIIDMDAKTSCSR